MPEQRLTVIIPMAGRGKRLRPLTWSRPKPLVYVAGDAVLGHVLRAFQGLDPDRVRFVFIIGYLGDQIRDYMAQQHPHWAAHYVEQRELLGQSHALWQAREYLQGPTLVLFVDTVTDADFRTLWPPPDEGRLWVREVEDPRRFGVVFTDSQGRVTRIIEKPATTEHRLAVVGIYYFPRGEALAAAIEKQLQRDLRTKGEYYLADAINILIQEEGLVMRPVQVETWLDAGTPETVLALNRYLLDHGRDNTVEALRPGAVVIPPVYIHPEAVVEDAVVGPYVTLGPGAIVRRSRVWDSILDAAAQVEDSQVQGSLLGRRARIVGQQGVFYVADDSVLQPLLSPSSAPSEGHPPRRIEP